MISPAKPVVSWWSGGITSAWCCHICIKLFGIENVRLIFIDTKNEDDDTYRFKQDCEQWYGKEVEIITNEDYACIQEVWFKFQFLNAAAGAICSSELKRTVRQRFQRENLYSHQAFGFDIDEAKRARGLVRNYPESLPIFPLMMFGLSKKQCLDNIIALGIEPPRVYQYGITNNNCWRTGCVQGGIGYWQKIQKEFPKKFMAMAAIEHQLTDLRGEPVTIAKDQSKANHGDRVFLLSHPAYPDVKDISMFKGRMAEPLMECNGFCGEVLSDEVEVPPALVQQLSFLD